MLYTPVSFPPLGRTHRPPSVCPGLRVAWVLISSPRMAPCPLSPPAHITKICRTTTITTTTCSNTPSGPPQTLPLSSQPRAARPATDHPAITEPPPPPTTATTTTAPCHVDSPSPLDPAPMGAPYPDQSATPSCPRPRRSRRPTASLSCSFRRLPPPRRCPPPQSQPPTSPGWEGCPLWCLRRTRPDLWSNASQHWQNSAVEKKQWNTVPLYCPKGSTADIGFLRERLLFSKELH